ncbi:MAG: DUF167 domain-containing protein [Marinibacterium sp.]
MGKAKYRDLPDLTALARSGAEIGVRATPKAGRDRIVSDGGGLRVYVTAVAENGKANAAVRSILAAAMQVPPTSLTLIRGASARDKTFRYDPPGGASSGS